jgi:hypothetical protein
MMSKTTNRMGWMKKRIVKMKVPESINIVETKSTKDYCKKKWS